jgi:hypothetical protein
VIAEAMTRADPNLQRLRALGVALQLLCIDEAVNGRRVVRGKDRQHLRYDAGFIHARRQLAVHWQVIEGQRDLLGRARRR